MTIPESEYHALAEARGFEFLGPYTGRVKDKTRWRCNEGHEWSARYDNIRTGYGCPYCARTRPKTARDYRGIAEESGTEWVGNRVPSSVNEKTLWRCSEGHVWKATYHSRNQDNGCPECYRLGNCGENNPNWKPELTEEHRIHTRGYTEYQRWRESVITRDGGVCQLCGREGNIAHHIYSYKEFPEYRTDTWNGITMCEGHHLEFHARYGKEHVGALEFLDYLSQKGATV